MKRIHLIPGWSEGNWHLKQFSRAFGSEFTLERQAAKADIIIAHSSGCYSLPKLAANQLVILIDPPYWPGRPVWIRIFQNIVIDMPRQIKAFGLIFWLKLRFWNTTYVLARPWKHVKVWRSLRQTFLMSFQAERALVIRDSRDVYCSPVIEDYLKDFPQVMFISIAGLHESCWVHPHKYLDVARHLCEV